jgi:hypothetical protein
MTNFNDLGVLQKDSGTYAFALGAGLWTLDRLVKPFTFLNSGSRELLARNEWALCVRVLRCGVAASTSRSHAHQSALPVGSMSQILILSGTSSEGVVPTGGRYGSVSTFFACRHLSFEIRTDLLVR